MAVDNTPVGATAAGGAVTPERYPSNCRVEILGAPLAAPLFDIVGTAVTTCSPPSSSAYRQTFAFRWGAGPGEHTKSGVFELSVHLPVMTVACDNDQFEKGLSTKRRRIHGSKVHKGYNDREDYCRQAQPKSQLR